MRRFSAANFQPDNMADVKVRPYEPRDYDIVVPMWQAGFHEMYPHAYRDVTSSPNWLLSCTAIGAALFALGARRWAALFTTFGGLVYTPVGEWLTSALLWQGVLAQTRGGMQRRHLDEEWRVAGHSAFFVAVDRTERVVGCIGVKAFHTLHKERVQGVPPTPGEASVWRLSVAPGGRRLGVGRSLMAQAEGWARANACTHVSLLTGNPESQRFYAKLGYGVESEGRASRVLFGSGGAGEARGVWASLKLHMLRRRLHSRGSILSREL